MIVTLVGGDNATSFAAARKVYEQGGFSKSVAELTTVPLLQAISAGTAVTGESESSDPVAGTIVSDAALGATKISVLYDVSTVQANYSYCQVGGLPTPKLDGCK